MGIEWKIDVGNIIAAVALFIGFYGAHVQNIRRLEKIEVRLGMIYSWFTRTVINRGPEEESE